ncbi:hypothetical protein B0H14DRAFT_2630592 [Mycena olivaceomarginata]|nr:hypothetical protein B0H14DRAFT_2630592 [Mycena olivaceomarginata]
MCQVHNFQNIQQCAVPEHVRELMCSLVSIIAHILATAGKLPPAFNYAPDWICDKESCQFAFPRICWEHSFIPLTVGLCQDYDRIQYATLMEYKCHGIRSLYQGVTPLQTLKKMTSGVVQSSVSRHALSQIPTGRRS